MRRHHDIGGLYAKQLEKAECDNLPWEKRVDAIVRLLSSDKCRLLRIDEVRRGIEELGPNTYDELSYYERWISSVTNILIEKGVLNIDELGRKIENVRDPLETVK